MSSVYSMQRPGFWRVPKFKSREAETAQPIKKKVHFYDEFVQPNSPSNEGLIRGDIITKVEDYDARDLRHEDAQMLFRTQDNRIRLVVRRDNKIAMNSGKSNPVSSLPPPNYTASYPPPAATYPVQPIAVPQRAPSPLPRGTSNMAAIYANPIESLPHTVFPNSQQQQQQHYQPYQSTQQQQQHVNYPPPPPPRSCFSPQLTRDHYQTFDIDDNAAIQNQPYRSTPLVLPGAKVYHQQKNLPTESYMRHHPNPQMRGPPTHDFNDIMMKQKVADSVLHRYNGDDATNGPKVVHKQFNSPIGLYSDNLIENTIKSTMSPSQPQSAYSQAQPSYNPAPSQAYSPAQKPVYPPAQQQQAYSPSQQQQAYSPAQQAYAPAQQAYAPAQQAYSPGQNSAYSPVQSLANSVNSSSAPHSPNATLSRQSSQHHQNLPTKIQGYKKTVVYDPLKSETYRAIQENSYIGERAQEVSTPVQPRVFQPNRLVPGKKPVSSFPPPDPISRHPVNSMGQQCDSNEVIHQSGSFKRLMYHVLGETEY